MSTSDDPGLSFKELTEQTRAALLALLPTTKPVKRKHLPEKITPDFEDTGKIASAVLLIAKQGCYDIVDLHGSLGVRAHHSLSVVQPIWGAIDRLYTALIRLEAGGEYSDRELDIQTGEDGEPHIVVAVSKKK